MAYTSDTTDGELVRRALAGQAAACAELVRRQSPRVLAVCRAHIGRSDVAQDLAQESLLRAIRALPTLADPEKFGSWLRGIAVRVCLDWRKSKQSGQINFSALGHDSDDRLSIVDQGLSAADAFEHADNRQRLLAAVDQLPPECREALLLYYYDEMTYQDIAGFLGVSRATVNLRLAKARALLREALIRS